MSRITINSNPASTNAIRRLSANSAELYTRYERLSSGLRINHAKDDAAGLAVSSLLDVDRRVNLQGVRNINDGASLLSIAEGAVDEMSNIVIRLRELAEQAANGTISFKQRDALDQEAQELAEEYGRISRSTSFNGVAIIAGDIDSMRVQVGYGDSSAVISRLGGAVNNGTFLARTTFNLAGTAFTPTLVDDMNFDGIVDLVGLDGTNVVTRIGNADGTWNVNQTFIYGAQTRSPRFDDFNGDGYVDMIVAEALNDTANIHFGNSDGTFTAGRSFAIGSADGAVALPGDLNNDGIEDFTNIDTIADINMIRLGNGDGTFTIKYSQTMTAGATGLSYFDVNNDNIVDGVFGDPTEGTVSITLGNGDGSFKARISTQTSAGFTNLSTTDDLNGDGFLDLATIENGSNTISIYLANGNGTFRARVSYSTGAGPTSASRVHLNNDGILDLVVKDATDQTLSLMLGNGDGTFRARTTISAAVGNNGLSGYRDVNRDGAFDMILFDTTDRTISIYLGNSNSGASFLPDFHIDTRYGALKAIPLLTQAQTNLNNQRGTIGAFQSRLQSAANVAGVSGENFAAARSRIVDADVAEEAAALVRGKILQQASAAVLAQANQGPALALRLLSDF